MTAPTFSMLFLVLFSRWWVLTRRIWPFNRTSSPHTSVHPAVLARGTPRQVVQFSPMPATRVLTPLTLHSLLGVILGCLNYPYPSSHITSHTNLLSSLCGEGLMYQPFAAMRNGEVDFPSVICPERSSSSDRTPRLLARSSSAYHLKECPNHSIRRWTVSVEDSS